MSEYLHLHAFPELKEIPTDRWEQLIELYRYVNGKYMLCLTALKIHHVHQFVFPLFLGCIN